MTKYNQKSMEWLLSKKEMYEDELSFLKESLENIPPTSALGRLGITASILHRQHKLNLINEELHERKCSKKNETVEKI